MHSAVIRSFEAKCAETHVTGGWRAWSLVGFDQARTRVKMMTPVLGPMWKFPVLVLAMRNRLAFVFWRNPCRKACEVSKTSFVT